MRNTIKAKVGYEVRRLKNKPDTVRVYDGDEFLFEGEKMEAKAKSLSIFSKTRAKQEQ